MVSREYLPPADSFLELTGNTPLVRLPKLLANGLHVYAKLEQFNAGGSAKDRTAQALIEKAPELEELASANKKIHLVESSSGNLGLALARQANHRGWEFTCVVDGRVNKATVSAMKALGANIEQLTEPDPDTGDWLVSRRKRVHELVTTIPGAINLDQYSSRAAFDAHDYGTMTEIIEQLGQAPDAILVAMSTTGTIGGCARHLSRIGARTQVIGVDAEGSVLFGGKRGERHLPGYGAGVIPDLSNDVTPDQIVRIPDAHAVVGARVLTRAEGILPGASGGGVIAALCEKASELEEQLGPDAKVVVVIHDGGEAYMDTVYADDWVEQTLGLSAEECERKVKQWLA